MKMIEAGNETIIYEDPITKKKPEGLARIISIEKVDGDAVRGKALVYARVRFTGQPIAPFEPGEPIVRRGILIDITPA